jgi:hypothetical protein
MCYPSARLLPSARRRASCCALGFDALCGFRRELAFGNFQVVVILKIEPEFRTVAEIEAEPNGGVGRDAPPIVDDLGDSIG